MGFWKKLKKKVKKAAKAVKEAVEETGEDIKDAAEDLADDVKDTFSDAGDEIRNGIKGGGLIGGVLAFVGAGVGAIVTSVGHVVNFVSDFVGAVAGGVIGAVGAIVGGVLDVVITVVTLGRGADFGDTVAGWFTDGARALGELVQTVFDKAGDFAARIFEIAGQVIQAIFTRIRCGYQRATAWMGRLGSAAMHKFDGTTPSSEKTPRGLDNIDHLFVLVLENRSFDHMLGLAGLPKANVATPGENANARQGGQPAYFNGGAKLALAADPPHEFTEVQQQIQGPMLGFVDVFETLVNQPGGYLEDPDQVMRSFSSKEVPVIHKLASEFTVCDRWHSSLPGPTLPNRQFFHAATSGGLAGSPTSANMAWLATLGGFEYENGTIFDELTSKCISWRVYAGDQFPLVNTLKRMSTYEATTMGGQIRDLMDLPMDLIDEDDDVPKYIFVEPHYGHWWSDFKNGMSQHPLDSVSGGEFIIKFVYEALRASPIWNRSALIITYDEHGGFYDHVDPPAATPPGDSPAYVDWSDDMPSRGFAFDRLGVRVPAIVVSPWVERGVDQNEYDHASIVATIADRFRVSALTDRGRKARSLRPLFTRDAPRQDTPAVLPDVNYG